MITIAINYSYGKEVDFRKKIIIVIKCNNLKHDDFVIITRSPIKINLEKQVYGHDDKFPIFSDYNDTVRVNKGLARYSTTLTEAEYFVINFRYFKKDGIEASFTLPLVFDNSSTLLITNIDDRFSFMGNVAKKADKLFKINQPIGLSEYRRMSKLHDSNRLAYFYAIDSVAKYKLKKLSFFKAIVSPKEFLYYKWRILLDAEQSKIGNDNDILNMHVSPLQPILRKYKDDLFTAKVINQLNTSPYVKNNRLYLNFLATRKYPFDSCFLKAKRYDINKAYAYVVSNYNGQMREFLIYEIMRQKLVGVFDLGNPTASIDNAFKNGFIHTYELSSFLNEVKNSKLPGKMVFDFVLPDTAGKLIHLSDFRGKIVCVDFYFDPCGACRQWHQKLDAIKDRLKDDRFVVISVYWSNQLIIKNTQWMNIIKSNLYTNNRNVNLMAMPNNGIEPEIVKNLGGTAVVWIGKDGTYLRPPESLDNELLANYIKSKL